MSRRPRFSRPQASTAASTVDPKDNAFIGQDVQFFINERAARTTIPFRSGGLENKFDIIFTIDFSTPTPTPPPSPTPEPTPEPTATPTSMLTAERGMVSIEGGASSDTEGFVLVEGIAIFDIQHDGTGRFSVELLNSRGRSERVLVSGSGDYTGTVGVGLNADQLGQVPPGTYSLGVEADGPWTVDISQPDWTSGQPGPLVLRGSGDSVEGPIEIEAGRVEFSIVHDGSSDFSVDLVRPDGTLVDRLADERGRFDGDKGLGIRAGNAPGAEPGVHGLFVTADGNWTVSMQAEAVATPTPRPTPVPKPTPVPTPVPPPTATAPPAPTTAAPIAPTASAPSPPDQETPDPSDNGGGCGSPVGPVSPATAAANMLLLVAPLGLIAGIRTVRRRRR